MQQEKPAATALELAAALAALGAYSGANTAAEHAAERKRLGYSEGFYRMGLAKWLIPMAHNGIEMRLASR